jgi:hypothetical protein
MEFIYSIARKLFTESAEPSGFGLIFQGALAEWSKALDLNLLQ